MEAPMKQRKKQPLVTRQVILDAAGEGFAQTGYVGTGLGAIVAAAAVTKGALFHHFADKQALAQAWIDERLAPEIEAQWLTPLAAGDTLETLKTVCRSRLGGLRRGDPTVTLAAMAAELGGRDPVLGGRLERIHDHWRESISGLLERGKAAGGIHQSIKPAAEAAFLVAVVAGASVTAALAADPAALRACGTALEDYLDTLRSMAS
jgi:AcrR family transcriptional regulator